MKKERIISLEEENEQLKKLIVQKNEEIEKIKEKYSASLMENVALSKEIFFNHMDLILMSVAMGNAKKEHKIEYSDSVNKMLKDIKEKLEDKSQILN